MTGDCHVRFCEGLRVKFPGATRRGTRGVYVSSTNAERTANWPLFTWSPDPARIIRFDDREAAEAELARVQSFAANARLREVG
jgi:hypothetical protein